MNVDESRYRPTREPVFTETMQIGIVVRDLDATLRRYVDDYGIGPWHEKLPGQERQMRAAFSVRCPDSGARPGFACRKPKGKGPYDSHTRPAESLRTLKPWAKPRTPPTRVLRSTQIRPGGPEHSFACTSIQHHRMWRTSATRREGP